MQRQLHAVTSGKQSRDETFRIALAIQPYIDYFHIREKRWSAFQIKSFILDLVKAGIPAEKILVNDRVDIAAVAGAGGVQLAHHSIGVSEVKRHFPTLIIGASVHSREEAVPLREKGADFLLYGNVFATSSKEGKPGIGSPRVKNLVNAVDLPVIAIGGIKPVNVQEINSTGAAGIAVLSGIFLSQEPACAAKRYRQELDRR
jgi:thiazole tautomerase (transcriptional regulator TenI)